MITTLIIIGIALIYISFKAFMFFVVLILFFLYKNKETHGEKDLTDNKTINHGDINDYLSKNKAFFDICSPATGIVKRIAVHEGDYLMPGDTLLYITNQSGEEDNITVGVECFIYDIMVREGDVIREGQKLANANNL